MRLADRTTRLAALSIMLAVSVIVAGCGALTDKAAGTYNGAPESVKIIASLILPPTPTTIEVNDAPTAQRLYDAAVSLPVAPSGTAARLPRHRRATLRDDLSPERPARRDLRGRSRRLPGCDPRPE